jgi:hypothetical protein
LSAGSRASTSFASVTNGSEASTSSAAMPTHGRVGEPHTEGGQQRQARE